MTNSSENNNKQHQLHLSDVFEASPAEDEAETRVLQSIEDDDIEEQRRSTILSALPDESTRLFISSSSTKTKAGSVESELQGLTRHLLETPDKLQSVDDTDYFARNAKKLVNRAPAGHFKQEFNGFFMERKPSIMAYAKLMVMYLIAPFTGLACILFYFLDNPFGDDQSSGASISWWFLFVFVRQPITMSLARVMEAFVIDFLCLKTNLIMKIAGPFATLMVVQSKGWCFQVRRFTRIQTL